MSYTLGQGVSEDRPFQVRRGRVRDAKVKRAKTFLAVALSAAHKAGGLGGKRGAQRSTFGRGRASSLAARRMLGERGRSAVVKARVVRMRGSPGALRAHVAYLQRDGVTRNGEPGRLFGADEEMADGRAFAERCAGDRHHFRFIVSPDNAAELGSLKDFTRALMADATRDLGAELDWVAVDHWNTEHPHVHILMRGRTDQGDNLVISRDYIAHGLRARAGALVTQELGPRSEFEIRRALDAEVTAERYTRLDRALARQASRADGLLDLRGEQDSLRYHRIGRARMLERLGLATRAGSGRWRIDDDAELKLRALGTRGDIIKRLHRTLGQHREPRDWVLDAAQTDVPVIGRLAAHGLDDELKGTAFAIIDGIDGRAHHLALPSLEALGEPGDGAIVELRRFTDARGRDRAALAVRADWALDAQVSAGGATWLDRQLVAREPLALAEVGFGAEVRSALAARTDHLIRQGLASASPAGPVFRRGLLAELQRREVAEAGARLARETGLGFEPAEAGDPVSGVYRRRLALASGRFAMIDNGLGFQLVPWSPSLERRRGEQVDGIAGPGGIDWRRERDRGLGI